MIDKTISLVNRINAVKKECKEVIDGTNNDRIIYLNELDGLNNYINLFEKAWVYSQNTHYYYTNFDVFQNNLEVLTPDFLRELVNKKGFRLDLITTKIVRFLKNFEGLKTFISEEFTFIIDNPLFQSELSLYNSIINYNFEFDKSNYVNNKMNQIHLQKGFDFSKEIKPPPHLILESYIVENIENLESFDKFKGLVDRLIRYIEVKILPKDIMPSINSKLDNLYNLVNKFHTVVNQLKIRHSKRNTLEINDEYDVQDLMNSLLRLNFEDVRSEEYSPSYAGGASRIDFILKRENIAIEVKKTRPTLRAKELGEELIIDIARYEDHPYCNHLICFVYDAGHFIINPRGIEDDLNKKSTEQMKVEVFIRPIS